MLMCVAFDLDDTLYLERDYVRSGFEAVGRWVKANLGVEDFGARAWELFELGRRGDIFDVALREAGLPQDAKTVEIVVDIYRQHHPHIFLSEDARCCLQSLRQRAKLALISDGWAQSQRRKIEALSIASFFDLIVLTAELGTGFAKPHPAAFEKVERQFHAESNCCVYVADNPNKDFLEPKRRGWMTIRVRRPGGLHSSRDAPGGRQADLEIEDLSGLIALIEGSLSNCLREYPNKHENN